MRTRPGSRRSTEINVTPLVDIVLVLLIVFMVLTPLAEKQMALRVPERDPQARPVPPDQVPPDQVVLLVKTGGRVTLNDRDVSVEEAMAALAAAFGGHPAKVLFFNAEDGVSYDAAVRVLDLARATGVETIGMVTDPPARPAGPAH